MFTGAIAMVIKKWVWQLWFFSEDVLLPWEKRQKNCYEQMS